MSLFLAWAAFSLGRSSFDLFWFRPTPKCMKGSPSFSPAVVQNLLLCLVLSYSWFGLVFFWDQSLFSSHYDVHYDLVLEILWNLGYFKLEVLPQLNIGQILGLQRLNQIPNWTQPNHNKANSKLCPNQDLGLHLFWIWWEYKNTTKWKHPYH